MQLDMELHLCSFWEFTLQAYYFDLLLFLRMRVTDKRNREKSAIIACSRTRNTGIVFKKFLLCIAKSYHVSVLITETNNEKNFENCNSEK